MFVAYPPKEETLYVISSRFLYICVMNQAPVSYAARIKASSARICALLPYLPSYAVILGTGAGRLVGRLSDQKSIDYVEIPYLLPTTAPMHRAQLHLGTLSGVPVLLFEGRYHYYETDPYVRSK